MQINSNKLILLLVVLLLVFVLVGFFKNFYCAPSTTEPTQKNIILITLDGLRADHLSCFGYKRKTSPNIDSLAENGLVFDHIISTGCSTKTALTSLFISLDYRFHKHINHESILDGKFLTLAEALHDNGYATFGIVASAMLRRVFNFHQGFDVYEDFQIKAKKREFVSADLVAADALSILERLDKKKPFFLYCHIEEPHPPWIHNSFWLHKKELSTRFFDKGCTYIPDKYERDHLSDQKKLNLIAKYDGSIFYADSFIGWIIDKLKEKGLAKNTIIAISADHGFELLDHGTSTHGHCPYNEVVRIPLIIHVGTQTKGARIFHRLGRIFDIGPTLLCLAGVTPPPLWEGVNLLKGGRSIPKYAFTFGYNVQSVQTSHFKLIYQDIQSVKKHYWKSPGYEFYDLSSDPRELKDLSSSNLPAFMILKKELLQYRDDLNNKEYLPGTAIPKNAILDDDTIKKLKSLGYIE